jgi:hypothetical protein
VEILGGALVATVAAATVRCMRVHGVWLAVAVASASCGRIGFDVIVDVSMPAIDVSSPAIGCSDGTREGFVDLVTYPTIAGCAASWTGPLSLRATATGAACGDSSTGPGVPCAAPADACAPGWRMCGDTGDPSDLSSRLTAAQCDADAVGTFVAAMSHCTTYVPTASPECTYAPPYGCSAPDCPEAVCCGTACNTNNSCKDGVFVAGTKIRSTVDGQPGCAQIPPGTVTGVLCCK